MDVAHFCMIVDSTRVIGVQTPFFSWAQPYHSPCLYSPLRVSVSTCKSYGNKSGNWTWSWKYVCETAPSPPAHTQPLLEFPLPSCSIMFKTRWRARTGAPDRCWPFLNPARSHKFKRLSNSLCSRDITERRHLLSFWNTDQHTRILVLWSSVQGRGTCSSPSL